MSQSGAVCLPPKVFGCVAFVQNHTPRLDKLAPWTLKCVFVDTPELKKYISVITNRRYIVSADVTFL